MLLLEQQALGRSYGVDEEIDMGDLDDELAAIDEQLSLEAEVPPFFYICMPSLHLARSFSSFRLFS